ncbi:MFS transporter [Phytopseudomonas punonensis]|uniref:Predicted arabinose efflux permease, MFS family n=1 Tax=Phytopseudomonas punonensis TaxID=1220495 RepID=A0A1M7CMB3_9GAMM|nr:MFS transporter [Pseudomonas punonensis]SHL68325.1 Predicted arabinose efflux permease, MFS family [Pseudomonas punonensis]
MTNRNVLCLLIAAVSVVGLSMGATLPLVSLRLHEAGGSSLAIGVVSAMPAAGMILSAMLATALCRRYSARQLYLGCFALCAASAAGIEWVSSSLPALAACRLIMGLAMGLVVILGESWVNGLCNPQRRGQTVALYAACFTGCQLGGPALISILGTQAAWIVLIVTLANLATLALIWQLPDQMNEDEEHARNFSLLGFFRIAPALCIGVLFFSFFDAVILSLFPIYASSQGYALAAAALMASVILAGDMLFQVPLGWLADRLERRALHLACGVVSLACGIALPWLIGQPSLLWPTLIILGAAAGGVYTLALILIGQDFRGADLVTANASVGMLWGIGSLLGPLLSGALMAGNSHGLPLALSLAASLFVLAALSALRSSRRTLSQRDTT